MISRAERDARRCERLARKAERRGDLLASEGYQCLPERHYLGAQTLRDRARRIREGEQ